MRTNFAIKINNQQFNQRGFTLIELLVVIVIVAILFTYTTLAIRGNSPEDEIKEEAHRLERLIELALEESILRGEEYGIEFFIDGYRFLHYVETQWEPITQDTILRQRELPEKMEIETRLEDSPIVIDLASEPLADNTVELDESDETDGATTEKIYPHIYLLSSGEIAPDFDVRFYIPGVELNYIVKGIFDGTLSTEISDL
jgi:general secretion pathway protein H